MTASADAGTPSAAKPRSAGTPGVSDVFDVSDIRLVLVYGGRSAEHDISCVSARAVAQAAAGVGFTVEPVAISRDGTWLRADAVSAVLADPTAELPPSLPVEGTPAAPHELLNPPGAGPVVVFPVVHGPMGEDGTLQGLCELAGVAYVGCGVLSSAVCMDKGVAKQLLAAAGLPQAPHVTLHATGVANTDVTSVFAELGDCVFVKPANMGSSIGISRVSDAGDLAAAVDLALTYDEWVIIEQSIEGREIECAVLGHNHAPRASLPGEATAGAAFRHYADKYLDGLTQLTIPAALDPEVTEHVRLLAVKAFRALRCEGMARVDFFLQPDGQLLVNEVNTIPGFTPYSMYPSMWAASGLPYPELVRELVGLARERHHSRRVRTDVGS